MSVCVISRFWIRAAPNPLSRKIGDSHEDRQHPDQTELLGEQQSRQNDPDDELHAPLRNGLDKTPGEGMDRFLLKIVCHYSVDGIPFTVRYS